MNHHALPHALLLLATLILLARALGTLLQHVGQPPVIGEVIAGITLGPSILGQVAPEASQWLVPTSSLDFLSTLAQLGIVLFMFVVGLEFDDDKLRKLAGPTLAVAQASIAIPFGLGCLLSLAMHPALAPSGVSRVVFALFIGLSLSVTAFPVLARILGDLGIAQSPLGVMALVCAAVDDAIAWCLLALVVALAQTENTGAMWLLPMALAFCALLIAVVRPLVRKYFMTAGESSGHLTIAVGGALLCAAITDVIGIHALFGAFAFGAIFPHDAPITHRLVAQLKTAVGTVLLPAFFALTGLKTQLGLLDTMNAWLWCALIIALASVGKIGGAFMAARYHRMDVRTSVMLGLLLNTRGLMQLIVLGVGLQHGIIDAKLHAMLVVMALVTTLATSPAVKLLADVDEKLGDSARAS